MMMRLLSRLYGADVRIVVRNIPSNSGKKFLKPEKAFWNSFDAFSKLVSNSQKERNNFSFYKSAVRVYYLNRAFLVKFRISYDDEILQTSNFNVELW